MTLSDSLAFPNASRGGIVRPEKSARTVPYPSEARALDVFQSYQQGNDKMTDPSYRPTSTEEGSWISHPIHSKSHYSRDLPSFFRNAYSAPRESCSISSIGSSSDLVSQHL